MPFNIFNKESLCICNVYIPQLFPQRRMKVLLEIETSENGLKLPLWVLRQN